MPRRTVPRGRLSASTRGTRGRARWSLQARAVEKKYKPVRFVLDGFWAHTASRASTVFESPDAERRRCSRAFAASSVFENRSKVRKRKCKRLRNVCERCGNGQQLGCGELVGVTVEVTEMAACDA